MVQRRGLAAWAGGRVKWRKRVVKRFGKDQGWGNKQGLVMRGMAIWKQRHQDNPLASGQHSRMGKGDFPEIGNSRGGADGGVWWSPVLLGSH